MATGEQNTANVTTIESFLRGCVNYVVSAEAINTILIVRSILAGSDVELLEKKKVDLARADLLLWVALSPSSLGTTEEADGGWRHKEGGTSLTKGDKNKLISEANVIYEMYGEPKKGRSKITITSSGIYRSDD